MTSYDYDVAINEFGWPSEPKYSHSAALHQVLAQYEQTLVQNERAQTQSLGTLHSRCLAMKVLMISMDFMSFMM